MSRRIIADVLRWLFVPVSAAAVVLLAIVAGRSSVAAADARCPAENMVGGACVEPWHTTAVEVAIYAAVVVAAVGLVWVPALVAPRFRRAVAALGFMAAAGGCAGLYLLTRWPELLGPVAAATASGAAALWLIWTRSTPHAQR